MANNENLRRGNPGNKGGRPPNKVRRQREQFLSEIEEAGSAKGPGTLYGDAIESLRGLIAEGDAATVRWYFDQLMGTAKTTTEMVIADTQVFIALGDLLPDFFETEDKCKEFLYALKDKLGTPTR